MNVTSKVCARLHAGHVHASTIVYAYTRVPVFALRARFR
jgi:hypothetical protein